MKSRKIDDLEQNGRRESLRFSEFEAKKNEVNVKNSDHVKCYIKNSLDAVMKDPEYSRIRRIGQKIKKDDETF